MPRIPASDVFSDQPTSGGGTASRRVLKSHNLNLGADVVMVNPVSPAVDRAPQPPPAPAGAPAETAQRQPAHSVQEALATAERTFERRLAAEVARAEKEAYDRGYAEGHQAGTGEAIERNAVLRAVTEGFERAWETMASNSEPLLAELSVRMAEAIIESPLPESVRTLSTVALSDAIERLGDTRAVTVTVHPADYMSLEESGVLGPLSENHPNMNWRTDAALDRGDWEARTDAAVVRRVARELLGDLRDRLGNLEEDGA